MTIQAPSISPHSLCNGDVLRCPSTRIVAASAYVHKIAVITASHKNRNNYIFITFLRIHSGLLRPNRTKYSCKSMVWFVHQYTCLQLRCQQTIFLFPVAYLSAFLYEAFAHQCIICPPSLAHPHMITRHNRLARRAQHKIDKFSRPAPRRPSAHQVEWLG